jgi:hypothetical protein
MTRRDRSWAWALSLATGVVLTLPFLLMPLQRRFYAKHFPAQFAGWPRNGSFSPLESMHLDVDMFPYAARMREAGTHAIPYDPHIKENRTTALALRDFLSFEVLGLFYRAAGSVPAGWVLAQFAFSALWVWALAWLLGEAGVERPAALSLAVILTLFNDWTRLPMTLDPKVLLGSVAQYSLWLLGSYNYWFGPTRFTRPLLTYPALFAAAVLAARAARTRRWGAALAAGAAGGLLSLVHPDVWALYFGATGLFSAWLWATERRFPLTLAGSLALTAALSAPWALISLRGSRIAAETAVRAFDPRCLIYAAFAAAALSKRKNAMAAWWGCALAGVALLLNASLLTGHQGSEPTLWIYLGNTFALIVLAKLFADRARLSAASWRWLAAAALLAALPRAFGYAQTHYRLYAMPQDDEAALSWLEANAPKDSVVAALSPLTVSRLPVYAGTKTLAALIFPLTSDLSFEDNAARLRETLALYHASPKAFVDQGFDASSRWEDKLWGGVIDDAGHERSGLIARYFNDLSDPGRLLILLESARPSSHGADYVWVGPFERALMGRFKIGGKPVYENATVALYATAADARARTP